MSGFAGGGAPSLLGRWLSSGVESKVGVRGKAGARGWAGWRRFWYPLGRCLDLIPRLIPRQCTNLIFVAWRPSPEPLVGSHPPRLTSLDLPEWADGGLESAGCFDSHLPAHSSLHNHQSAVAPFCERSWLAGARHQDHRSRAALRIFIRRNLWLSPVIAP